MATISPTHHGRDSERLGTRAGSDADLASAAEALTRELGELIRVVQFRDRDRACCHDLSVSQCYALKGVVDAGGMTVNDLAAHLYLDKSTASRIASGLVDKGLVDRVRDVEDGRVVRLIATPTGVRTHDAIEAELASDYTELLADFPPEARASAVRLVARLARAFAGRVEVGGGSCCVPR